MPNVTVYVVTNWQNLPTKTSPIDSVNLNHLETGVKNVTDFLNTINAESGLYLCATPFTTELKNKLDGIEAQANKYVLPTAGTNVLGGVKVDGVTITIDQNGVISSAASSTSLENLTDVDLDNLSDGQILKYDSASSKWVNATNEAVTTLANLTDTEITNPSDGQILKYDATSGKWINGTGGGGGASALNDLSDVDLTTPAQGQVLKYDGSEWVNDEEDILSYNDTLTTLGEPAVEPSQDIESYQRDLLWGNPVITYPPSRDATYTLSANITDYDEIEFVVGFPDNVYCIENWKMNAKLLASCPQTSSDNDKQAVIPINPHANQFMRFSKGSSDNSIAVRYNGNVGIYQIYGIKYNCMSVNQGSGFRIKSFTYTGDGNVNHNLTFPEIPKMIVGITSENAIGFKVGTASIVWGAPAGLVYWTGNTKGSNPFLLSYNSNTITIVGTDAGQSLNADGATYTVYYI